MKVKNTNSTYQALKRKFSQKIDPWNFGKSKYERERFEKMLDLIKTVPHKRILEVGCAEGHFTQKLLSLSEDITAIDLSEDAIKRAKVRAPEANYICTTLENMEFPKTPYDLYDLVVCSEVIYYIDDKKSAVDKIKKLGKFLLSSSFFLHILTVESHLSELKLIERVIHFRLRELKFCSITLWEIGAPKVSS